MDNQLMQAEWDQLEARRRQITDEAKSLKGNLDNLSVQTNIAPLMKEKDGLVKRIRGLENEIDCHNVNILNRKSFMRNCQLVLERIQTQKEFDRTIDNFTARIRGRKAPKMHPILIQGTEEIISTRELPLRIIKERLLEQNAKEEAAKKEKELVRPKLKEQIAHIEEYYRDVKKWTEEQVRAAELAQEEHLSRQLQWATQDHFHLQWIIENQPAWKDKAISHYKARWPRDSIDDLIKVPVVLDPPIIPQHPKKWVISDRDPPCETLRERQELVQDWKFFVTFTSCDYGEKLPLEKVAFVESLHRALRKIDYFTISPVGIYERLMRLVSAPSHQRNQMDAVLDKNHIFLGWKILRVGRNHRLFLSIDENKRIIRFNPAPRSMCYALHK